LNFSQLIKTLADYLDLGKRIATTIPGMVLASALVLFFFNPNDVVQYRQLAQRTSTLQANQYKAELDAIERGQKDINAQTTAQSLRDLRTQLNGNQGVWSQLTSSYTGILQQFFYLTLFLGLLGFAIGTVLDPVNKALFVQIIPEIGEQSKSPTIKYLTGHSILEDSKNAIANRHGAKPIGARILQERSSRMTAQFYIGRGLITASEYNDLVDKYYLYTQISIGMIIPSLTVAALGWYLNHRLGPILVAVALILSFFLERVGLRRYGEFHGQVFDLIAGREQARDEQSQQVSKDHVVNLARALSRVEHVSIKLDESVKHSEAHLAGRIEHLEELIRRVENAMERPPQR